jgi:hypothetical protein
MKAKFNKEFAGQAPMSNDLIIRRLAFIKGYLETIQPQQDEATQEDMRDLIWVLDEDIQQLEAIELAIKLEDARNDSELNSLENQSPEC